MRVFSRVFRGKFVAGLKQLFRKNRLQFFGVCEQLSSPKAFNAFARTLFREDWVVYSKPPFGGPSMYCITWLAPPIASESPITGC